MALPGAIVWRRAWGDGAHFPSAARHTAFNDHIFAGLFILNYRSNFRLLIETDHRPDHINLFFRAPRKKKLFLTQQVELENRNGRLDAAATPPAETSSVSNATPSVWKKESELLIETESGLRVAAVESPRESTES